MIQTTAVLNGDATNEAILISLPDDYASRTLNIVVYHHGAGENFSAMNSDILKQPLLAGLLSAGCVVISSNAFGDNCGNDASLDHYDDIVDYVIANYTTTSKVGLWSQSFGGISGLLQLARGDSRIKGWLGVYPACNSPWMYTHGFGSLYNSAFGISDVSGMPAGKDPVSLSGSLFNGKRMYFFHSPDDTVVTELNNTDPMRTLVTGHARQNVLELGSGNHGESYVNTANALAFFDGEFTSGTLIHATTVSCGTMSIR